MPRSKTMLLKVNAALFARIARAAKAAKKPRSAFVRQALEEKLAATAGETSCGALAADLAGCIEGTKDASTGARWLDGYGE
jgi:hypothetical protein